jgi:DNA-directed RNA polymerase specialized sigma24 family protein
MDTFQHRRRIGRHGTDIDGLLAVQAAVRRLVAGKYGGWSPANREDLESLVVERYVAFFGRANQLPVDDAGQMILPIAWLKRVIVNAGIDAFRKQEVRPADPVDFGANEPLSNIRLFEAGGGAKRLSVRVAEHVDLSRTLAALSHAYPTEAQLIRWHYAEDRDVAEIAVLVGKTEVATRKAIYRAAVRLRELLSAMPPASASRATARRVLRRS